MAGGSSTGEASSIKRVILGESAVTGSANGKFSKFLRRVVAAIVASGTAATPLAYAWPSDRPIVMQPAALPELARQPGQAMFLYDSVDGRTLLYVEQSQGTRLAIFDVTNPARIKSAGAVQLDAPGPFDFVSTFGNRAEAVRFRQGQGNAVLDLNKASAPALKTVQRLTLQGITMPLIENGSTARSQIDPETPPSQDYRLLETESLEEFKGLLDARDIRGQVTKRDTGTTFLLTDSGLYVIRRPIAERNKERREDELRIMYSGG
jgi:hypothetical protein